MLAGSNSTKAKLLNIAFKLTPEECEATILSNNLNVNLNFEHDLGTGLQTVNLILLITRLTDLQYDPTRSAKIIKLLLDKECNPNLIPQGMTALHWAVYLRKKEIVKVLLDHDSTLINIKGENYTFDCLRQTPYETAQKYAEMKTSTPIEKSIFELFKSRIENEDKKTLEDHQKWHVDFMQRPSYFPSSGLEHKRRIAKIALPNDLGPLRAKL